MESGRRIRKLREECAVRPIDVERISRSIAEEKARPEFYVSRATLADVENGSVPSIFKIFSLACALRVRYDELLLLFGVDPRETRQYPTRATSAEGRLPVLDLGSYESGFHLNFGTQLDLKRTNLLNFDPKRWSRIPAALRKQLTSTFLYALIGTEDDTMSGILPPGSIVEIDPGQTEVSVAAWRSLDERPIYFVRNERGYSCFWCQLDGNELTLVPHPASHHLVRRF